MAHNRNGKPTAHQVAAIKKAGLTLKGIKTYRDAENALRRLARAAKAKKPVAKKSEKPVVAAKPEKKPVEAKKPVKPVAKKAPAKAKKPTTVKKPVAKPDAQKRIAGCGCFRVQIDKADVIEALLLCIAKLILCVLERK